MPRLFSEQESFSLDTPEGRMLVGILASFAAFEADLISARTKAALAVVRKNGSKSGRPIGNPKFDRISSEIELFAALRGRNLLEIQHLRDRAIRHPRRP